MNVYAPLDGFADGETERLHEFSRAEILHASRLVGDGMRRTDLSVPTIHCGGCLRKIERALGALDGVESARVNLSTKRVSVLWRTDCVMPPFVQKLMDLGHEPHLEESGTDTKDKTLSDLVRALAVAGFATANIMALSVAVWSGAEPAARGMFHWVSALIALPALVYSGRVFFRSAFRALRHGTTNMDVPISVGVILAFGLSLFDTIRQGEAAYFEASVMLLFFLLIGRTLDHLMRERVRRAVTGLARLVPRAVQVVRADGRWEMLHLSDVEPGMTIVVATGERIPVDGRVVSGASELDCALVSGESMPQPVSAGMVVQAGMLNLTGPLTLSTIAAEKDSFLAEMARLMATAEAGRSTYRRIADRAAGLYTPLVHAAALASFAGWMVASSDVHRAVTIAVAVLIITCPCALGLAVPMVHVVSARRLFEHGILVKDGGALERMSEIDTVVFDKTGTLTDGRPTLVKEDTIDRDALALAAAVAAHSRHPYSRALAAAARGGSAPHGFDEVSEHPGCGLEAMSGADRFRLGRAEWALDTCPGTAGGAGPAETVLSRNGKCLAVFRFDDPLRPDGRDTVTALQKMGLAVHVLSGDRAPPVRRLARALGVDAFRAEVRPQEKVAYLESLSARGCRVLMVGDGLNDVPALAAAHASMAPATAADVGRRAADFVFLRDGLDAVLVALRLSRRANRLVRQNFLLAIAYNVIALPFAVLGYVTPLAAALAMSSSSTAVVANALRLNGNKVWRHLHRRKGAQERHVELSMETSR